MNISLIGMMGAGKTTVGKFVEKLTKEFSFIDIDEEIVKSQNCSISKIFETKGEAFFRKLESEFLFKILSSENQIISTGGGIISSVENINLLKSKSIVIYLSASANVLYNRIKEDTSRPLLNSSNVKQKIETILQKRLPSYKQAHFEINTENKHPQEIAQEIIKIFSNLKM